MTSPADPRRFVLTWQDCGPPEVMGYGLALPDGSAISVSWPPGQGQSVYSSGSAEDCARAREADLVWLDKES